ncbi:hypothetical protein VHEMI05349 [[Torrubiella] hemipterigena]|uniref:Uncharacterized protein n=1 Tax=[Torrubiella] hemipterigena TaxID=1531966 RepID=A0A0A1TGS2_9HYPO|nr:hypothetical protein VHEMI05349 [[Torrubiella] hemipterigena]
MGSSKRSSASSAPGSPFDPNFSFGPKQRVDSYASTTSTGTSVLRRASSNWIKPSPTVNVHTTCGRHSDQLLFGGPSLKDMAKALLGKK